MASGRSGRPYPAYGPEATGWQPPAAEVRPVYQPVEIRRADGTWTVGRINAWWEPAEGEPWCRVRPLGRGESPAWMRFDPASLLLLPVGGT
ncbi:hypothetical protein [Kitasatospora camelliae]|uniref:Uncharacterized protein n=1 Tax=Kitasatospora camelliae TaxID=3156397 RepID=A0AAU8JSN9_9ACTN